MNQVPTKEIINSPLLRLRGVKVSPFFGPSVKIHDQTILGTNVRTSKVIRVVSVAC